MMARRSSNVCLNSPSDTGASSVAVGKVASNCSSNLSNFSGVNLLMIDRHCSCGVLFIPPSALLRDSLRSRAPLGGGFPAPGSAPPARRRQVRPHDLLEGDCADAPASAFSPCFPPWEAGAAGRPRGRPNGAERSMPTPCFRTPFINCGTLYPASSRPNTISSIGTPYRKLITAAGESAATASAGGSTSRMVAGIWIRERGDIRNCLR
mmetsp:Transcript_29747/g.85584  ORF Transcript_29747/g.85584 Transcript_29747/m.85584 type:complete len:208 (+) Transcript_29747:1402-2025(+)